MKNNSTILLNKRKNQKGYSMVEVIAAIAILGIVTLFITQTFAASAGYFQEGKNLIEENSEATNQMEQDEGLANEGEISFGIGARTYEVSGDYLFQVEKEDGTFLKSFLPPEIDNKTPEKYLQFNGNTQINLNTSSFNQHDLTDGYTIAVKIKVDRTNAKIYYMGVYGLHYGNNGSEHGLFMQFYDWADLEVEMWAHADFTSYNNQWVTWVQTYDPSTRTQILYANGVEVGRDTYTYRPLSGTTAIGNSGAYNRRLIGGMSMFRTWDVVLSPDEVANINLDAAEPQVRKNDIYLNLNVGDENEVKKHGSITGTGIFNE